MEVDNLQFKNNTNNRMESHGHPMLNFPTLNEAFDQKIFVELIDSKEILVIPSPANEG